VWNAIMAWNEGMQLPGFKGRGISPARYRLLLFIAAGEYTCILLKNGITKRDRKYFLHKSLKRRSSPRIRPAS
ncbi:MAG TPA: hypothetical protein PLU94_05680, partial [Methanoregulaceae archaeon]|nr:hypothetical protein [Methanoregulaceae archaeon]